MCTYHRPTLNWQRAETAFLIHSCTLVVHTVTSSQAVKAARPTNSRCPKSGDPDKQPLEARYLLLRNLPPLPRFSHFPLFWRKLVISGWKTYRNCPTQRIGCETETVIPTQS